MAARIILICFGATVLILAVRRMRSYRLKERHMILFLLTGLPFLLLAVWPSAIGWVGQKLDVQYQTVSLLCVAAFFILVIFELLTIVSLQDRKIATLAQIVGILMEKHGMGDRPSGETKPAESSDPRPDNMTRVAILIACFNGRKYLGDCLRSLQNANVETSIILIDNASTDGSADFIATEFPAVDLLRLRANLGFAGGINAGWRQAREKYPDLKYVALVNQDVNVDPNWLSPLITHLDSNPATAAVQPKVMLAAPPARFNTAGNRSHYLGFGLVTAFGQPDDGSHDQIREIDFPSGAACVIRAGAIGTSDIFDDLYFLYLEDAELGWKLRQLDFKIEFVPASIVWHHYEYRHDYKFYFYLERNRWYLLATYFKFPTLLLLLPAILAMEFGQLYFARRNGVLSEKLRAYRFFLCRNNFARLMDQRRRAQQRRRISDRRFVRDFVSEIDLPELRSNTLRRIGNPLLRTYWHIVRPLIIW